MRKDWLKELRSCAKIPCSFKIQRGHYHWYSGEYNKQGPDYREHPRLGKLIHYPGTCASWIGTPRTVKVHAQKINERYFSRYGDNPAWVSMRVINGYQVFGRWKFDEDYDYEC